MSIQNIYDDQTFFEGYKALRNNNKGFNAVLEQPALRSLVGDCSGKVILDIGCGFGDFCRYARASGAKNVIGIDPSKNMIAAAQADTQDDAICYQCVPVENYESDDHQFDCIVSSLAFHYVADFEAVVKKMYRWLKPKGLLVFSVEHPICTAKPSAILGEDEQGLFHALHNYRDERLFEQKWFIEGVKKYHRLLSTYLNNLLNNGFSVNQVLEPMPRDEQIQENPHFSIHKIRPPLLIISASVE